MRTTAVPAVLLTGMIGLAIIGGCVESDDGIEGHDNTSPSRPTDGVFIHISSGLENPHPVLMGLQMAELMSVDHDVIVYFDVKGIDVIAKDAPDLMTKPFNSSHKSIRGLIKNGVGVYACPGCMKACGKTRDDLMAGVKVATKQAFFGFTEGRILSLDY